MYNRIKLFFIVISALLLTACSNPNGNLSTELPNANNLEKGDFVRLNGVDIGDVASVELEPNSVIVHMNINKNALQLIDANATVAVNGGSDPYVVILNPDELKQPVEKGAVLAAATDYDAIGDGITRTLSGMLGSLQQNIENQDWAGLANTIEQTTESLTRSGTELGEALESTVGSMMEGFEGSMEELEPQIEELSKQMAEEFGDGSAELQQTIETIMGQIANSVAEGIEKGQKPQ